MYTHVSTPPTSTTPSTTPAPATTTHSTITASAKELTMRINPSDILFAILSIALLLAAGFAAGGLAAHPF